MKEVYEPYLSAAPLALSNLAENGSPRCCKRNSYLTVLTALDFAAERLGVFLEKTEPVCSRSLLNAQFIGKRCPLLGGNV